MKFYELASLVSRLPLAYKPDYKYARIGILLIDLQSARIEQMSLDLGSEEPHNRTHLMQALNNISINQRYGRGTLHLASAGTAGKHRGWKMKQERETPGFTTDWLGLAQAG